MDLLEITRKQDPLYPAFEQVYATSFPLFEQRTEQQQEQAFQSPNYHLEVYLKDNLFIGFISYSHYIYRCIFHNEKVCFCNKYSKGATHHFIYLIYATK